MLFKIFVHSALRRWEGYIYQLETTSSLLYTLPITSVVGANDRDLVLDRGTVSFTKSYKYLGVNITNGGFSENEIKKCIGHVKVITKQLNGVTRLDQK